MCIFSTRYFVDLERDGQIRIDNVVDIEGFLDKIDLIHVPGSRTRAMTLNSPSFLAKDAMIMFFSSLSVQAMRKSKVSMSLRPEQADLLGIADDGQYVVLMGNAIDDRFVFIYDGDRVIASASALVTFIPSLPAPTMAIFMRTSYIASLIYYQNTFFDYFASKKNVKKLQAATSVNTTNIF